MNCNECGRVPTKPFPGGLCSRCAVRAALQAQHDHGMHREPASRCPTCRGFRVGDEIETGRIDQYDTFLVGVVSAVGRSLLTVRRIDGSEAFVHASRARLVKGARQRLGRGHQ